MKTNNRPLSLQFKCREERKGFNYTLFCLCADISYRSYSPLIFFIKWLGLGKKISSLLAKKKKKSLKIGTMLPLANICFLPLVHSLYTVYRSIHC